MKVSDIGEFGLIDRIKDRNPIKDRNVVIGIGDDAAAIRSGAGGKYILLTTDTLVEGVHFSLRYFTFFELGWKLLAVNLSDIAAMGGTPRYALVTLGLKRTVDVSDIDAFYKGIRALAGKFKVNIVGGDIVSSPKNLFFTLDVFGFADRLIKRSGAKAGDAIVSLGTFGGSAAGLAKLKRSGRKASGIKTHVMPWPMIKEGLSAARHASSMIDNSDGLARCLIEICKASGCGARIFPDKIPLAKGAHLKHALDGGEDYNLVLTVPKRKAKKIKNGRIIGEITAGKGIYLIDKSGRKTALKDKGYEQL